MPGRIYDGGVESLIDLVDVDSVSVEELDVLMYELGYDLGQKNYYYFLKPGSNLDDGLYSLSATPPKFKRDSGRLIGCYFEDLCHNHRKRHKSDALSLIYSKY